MSLQLLLAYLVDERYVPFIVKLQYTSACWVVGRQNTELSAQSYIHDI